MKRQKRFQFATGLPAATLLLALTFFSSFFVSMTYGLPLRALGPVPVISSVSPSTGSVAGGDSVTISGADFSSDATVKIADATAITVAFIDASTLVVTTPAGVAGARSVTVTNGDGQPATTQQAFTYINLAPSITSLSPSVGPAAGGQEVTITGQNFTPGFKEMSKISSGGLHSCGIYDNQAYCWGDNAKGQLGNNTRNASLTPSAVYTGGVLAGKTIRSISAGTTHTCAVASDNLAYCWGDNQYGRLGNGTTVNSLAPVAVTMSGVLAGKTIQSVSVGVSHSCVVASDGQVYCWGYNSEGQLGNNSTAQSLVPVAVATSGVLAGKSVTSISAGNNHTCAVASDLYAYCWGYNAQGQLGNNSTTRSVIPVAVLKTGALNGKTILSISLGYLHTCAVASDNQAYCWGYNQYGQLGNSTTTQSTTPVAVTTTGLLAGKAISSVAAGYLHTCAVTANSQSYCWGYNNSGQLGNNSTTNASVPVAVALNGVLTDKTIRSISTGTYFSCAVASNNQTYCWGLGTSGQLGNGNMTSSSVAVASEVIRIRTPIVLFGDVPSSTVTIISNTTLKAVAPTTTPSLMNVSVKQYDDQIASATNAYSSAASPQIDAVAPTTATVTGGDTVTITGQNLGSVIKVRFADTEATAVTNVDDQTVTVVLPAGVAGARHVILEDIYGQTTVLQNGFIYTDPAPFISSISPSEGPAIGGQEVTITGQNFTPGFKEISQISSGGTHSCGIYNGQAYCWGTNTKGQLGDNTRNTSAIPSAVDTSGALAGKTIIAISAGISHTCAVASDNQAYCWGDNQYGRLGNGTTVESYVPVAVSTSGVLAGKTIRSISAGTSHTCAVASDNQAYCWGYNTDGALGNNSVTQATTPVAVTISGVLSGKTINSISAGKDYTCAVASDNQAYCWGYNDYGQLGTNSTARSLVPVAVDTFGALAGKGVQSISAGMLHTCAVTSDNQAYCWGYNGQGALGNGTTTPSYVPAAVLTTGALSGKSIRSISASVGFYYTCAVTSDNQPYCWGYNTSGQLGNNSITQASSPVAVTANGELSGKTIRSVSTGTSHVCAIASDNQTYCWGLGTGGQLANGDTTNSSVPVAGIRVQIQNSTILFGENVATNIRIMSPTTMLATLPAHMPATVNVTMNRYDNQSAQLTDGYEFITQPSITNISPTSGLIAGGDTVTIQGANISQDIKVKLDAVYATEVTWLNASSVTFIVPARSVMGAVDITLEDSYGQTATLQNTFTYTDPAPSISSVSPNTGPVSGGQQVTITGQNFTPGLKEISQITAGSTHSCGIYDGQAYCWGDNSKGQLGDNTRNTSSVPSAVYTGGALAGKTILSISAGSLYTCAVASDNQAYCWGDNQYGKLGNGTTTESYEPLAVTTSGPLAGKTIRSVSAGTNHTCAVASDDLAYCWGYNTDGALGTGSLMQMTTPVAVATSGVLAGKTIRSISAGRDFTCAIASDNLAYCWGANDYGQLGTNSTARSIVPVAVDTFGALAGKTVQSISAGDFFHTCAVASDSQAYCWGYNHYGAVGNGNTAAAYAPQAVTTSGALAGKSVRSVSAGYTHSCAVASDDQVYCWGYNVSGQLGNNSTSQISTPAAVTTSGALAGKKIRSVATGSNHVCTTASDDQAYCWGLGTSGQLGNNAATNSSVAVAVQQVIIGLPKVLIGGELSTAVQLISNTQLTFTTPPHSPATVDVEVLRYDDQSAAQSNAYTFIPKPSITSVIPSKGMISGGDSITITGSDFNETVEVLFNSTPAASINRIDSNTLVVVTPASTAGARNVTVRNSDGQSTTSYNAFTFTEPNPTISSVSPNFGPAEGGQEVTITGQNFTPGLKEITQISTGNTHSCGIYNNQVYCWGDGQYGKLGNNTTADSDIPVAVTTSGALAGKTILSVSAGTNFSCAIASDNQAYCWGYNNQGQLGNGNTNNSSVPVAVTASGTLSGKTIRSLSAGGSHACVVASDDLAYCWGYNDYGTLGNNSTTRSLVPLAVDTFGVLSGKTVRSIAAGALHTCAVASDNQAYCWGYNNQGQLGNSSSASSYVPVAVTTSGVLAGKTIRSISVSAGSFSSCAVASDNQAYCWGYNTYGQLGNSLTTQSSSPVAVTTSGVMAGKTIQSISVGTSHACVVTADNQAYCWGLGTNGQLGNGDTTNSSSPVAVVTSGTLAGKKAYDIASGGTHTCLIASDNQAYCFGLNSDGQLGDDSVNTTSVPATVKTVTIRDIIVRFGSVLGTNAQIISPTSVKVAAPASNPGRVTVSVERYDGATTALSNAYQYAGGAGITSVSPSAGSVGGGDTVTIQGAGFSDGMRVKLGGNEASNVVTISDTTLTFVVPAGVVPGATDVIVEDAFGQTATLAGGYAYQLPDQKITAISPQKGSMSGGQTVTITGTDFTPKAGGGTWYTVKFGTSTATGVTYVNSTTLTAVTPARGLGVVDVTVSSSYSSATILPASYTYQAASYVFSNTALSVSANQPGKLTIQARNSIGNAVSSSIDTDVTLSSSSPQGQFAVDLNEAENTRWNHTVVTIPAGRTSVDVWYRDATSGNPVLTGQVVQMPDFTQTAAIGSKYKLQVIGISDPVKVGEPSSVTVRAVDFTGQALDGYTGTFRFESTDSGAVLPAQYAMTTADHSIKTFINGVTMATQGEYCVSVVDINDSSIDGEQCGISVQPANSGTITKLSVISEPQSITADSNSAPITIQTQGVDGKAIPVQTNTTIHFAANSPTAELSSDAATWVRASDFTTVISAGLTAKSIYYRDSATRTTTLSVRDLSTDTADQASGDFGWQNATHTIKTGVGAKKKLGIIGPTYQLVGDKSSFIVELQDADGNAVTATADIVVRVDASSTTSRFYRASDLSTALTGPIEITIPAGSTRASVLMSDTATTTGNQPISLYFVDGRPATETIRLDDATTTVRILAGYPTKLSLTTSQPQVTAGQPLAATIQLQAADGSTTEAPEARTVSLTATTGGEYSLTADPFIPISQVTFNTGDSQKTIYYRSSLAGNVQLNASSTSLTTGSVAVEVKPDGVNRFGVNALSSQIAYDSASQVFTVTAYDVFGNVTSAAADTNVYLYSSENSTRFALTANGPWTTTALTIPTAASSVQFYVKDDSFHQTSPQLTVSDQSTLDNPDVAIINATTTYTVVSQPAASMVVTSPQRTVTAGAASDEITVELRRADGSPAIQDGTTRLYPTINEGRFIASDDPSDSSIGQRIFAQSQSSTTFYYTGTKAGTYPLRLQMAGLPDVTQPITVQPAAASVLSYASASQSVETAVSSAPIRISFKDDYGNVSPLTDNDSIQLASSCATGTFSTSATDWQAVTSIPVVAGSSDVTVYYKDSVVGNCQLTAASAGLSESVQSIQVTNNAARAPVRLAVLGGNRTLVKGATTTLTVNLLDQSGDVVPAQSSVTLYFASSSTSGNFANTSVSFEPGEVTQSVTYMDNATGEATISIRDQAAVTDVQGSLQDTALQVTYREGSASGLTMTPSNSTIRVGAIQPITIGIVNEFGVATTTLQDTTVYLATAEPSGVFYAQADGTGGQITQLTIPAGQANATIAYKQLKSTSARLTANATGVPEVSAYVATLAENIAAIKFSSNPYIGSRALETGEEATVTVSAYDIYGNITTTANTLTLYATSSAASGSFMPSGQFTIPAGGSSGQLTYKQLQTGNYQLKVSDAPSGTTQGLGVITQNGEVTHGHPTQFRFNRSQLFLERGGVSGPITVELLNAYGQKVPATNGGQTITMDNNSGTGMFSLTSNGKFTSTTALFIPQGVAEGTFYYRNDNAKIEDKECALNAEGKNECTVVRTYSNTMIGRTDVDGSPKVVGLPVTMTYGQAVQLAFTTPERTAPAYRSSQSLSVQRQNQYGKPVPIDDVQTLRLRSSSTTGQFGDTKVHWGVDGATIQANATEATFYYRDSAEGRATITAADVLPLLPDVGLANAVQSVTIAPSSGPQIAENLLVTNISDPQKQGVYSSVVVIPRDGDGYIVEDYAGTISFTSDDAAAILPSSYTFDPSVDAGVHTFVNQVAFGSVGEKTVTATATNGISGSQSGITVTPGSTEPVEEISFTQPDAPIIATRNVPSNNISLQLQDAAGQPTNAPAGGLPVSLVSSSPTAEFSRSQNGPWVKNLSTTVTEGLAFMNFYYRDSQLGSALVTASVLGHPTISNTNVEVLVRNIKVEGVTKVQSLNVFGVLEDSTYLFAHDSQGTIAGAMASTFQADNLATGDPAASQWRTQWRQGVKLLDTTAADQKDNIVLEQYDIQTTAGQPDFYAVAEATDTTFANYDEIVSQQLTVPTSPWKMSLDFGTNPTASSQMGVMSVQDNRLLPASASRQTASISVYQKNLLASPASIKIQLVPSAAKSAAEALHTWAVLQPASILDYVIPTDGTIAGASYRIFATSYDTDGNTTAQLLSAPFVINQIAPIIPTPAADTKTETNEPTNRPTPQTNTMPVQSSPSRNTPSSTETIDPIGPNNVLPQSIDSKEAVAPAQVASDSPTVAATYATTMIVVVLLLRESYKEMMRVYRLRKILKRDKQLAIDKGTFLSLTGHYLRTPITILDAASSMITTAAATPIVPAITSLRQKADALLESNRQDVVEIDDPDIAAATRHAIVSIHFWLPIILSVILTISVIALLTAAADGRVANDALVYTGIVVLALALIGYFGMRTVTINNENAAMNRALQLRRAQLLNAKSSFMSKMQNEIKTEADRLRTILAGTELPGNVRSLLIDGVNRLDTLVGKLGLASQLNSQQLQPVALTPRDLVADILPRYQSAIDVKQLRVVQEYPVTDGAVLQDARMLRYVISTVLDNAVKFCSLGGTITITTHRRGKETILSIANDGTHFASIDIARQLFEPFNHAANPDDLTADGMGLSLYLDKMIMGYIGGSISAKNAAAKNDGTVFDINFSSLQ